MKTIFLQNDKFKLGINLDKGCAISYLSRPNNSENLLNDWDNGRLIQQSYYGKQDGSFWNGTPWVWNPVQGGSWNGKPSSVVSYKQTSNTKFSSTIIPRNWGGEQLLDKVRMSCDIELLQKYIHIKYRMKYNGNDIHPIKHQEVPAVFFNRKLSTLVYFENNEFITKYPVIFQPGQRNDYFDISTHWVAYINPINGYGVGILSPIASRVTAYRVGNNNLKPLESDCSYVAPIISKAISPGTEINYDVYIAIGKKEEIKLIFDNIHN
jgi:hypothetical protein